MNCILNNMGITKAEFKVGVICVLCPQLLQILEVSRGGDGILYICVLMQVYLQFCWILRSFMWFICNVSVLWRVWWCRPTFIIVLVTLTVCCVELDLLEYTVNGGFWVWTQALVPLSCQGKQEGNTSAYFWERLSTLWFTIQICQSHLR